MAPCASSTSPRLRRHHRGQGHACYDFTARVRRSSGTASIRASAPRPSAESFVFGDRRQADHGLQCWPPNAPAARLVGVNGLEGGEIDQLLGRLRHLSRAPRGRPTRSTPTRSASRTGSSAWGLALAATRGTSAIPAVTAAIIATGNVLDPTVTFTGINIFTNGLDTRSAAPSW